jgi:hypothetical protein
VLCFLAVVLAVLGSGCGAKTDLDVASAVEAGGDAFVARRDAAVGRRDGGVRDAGRDAPGLDAGPECTWREVGAPLDVFREPTGIFSRPQVVRMGEDTALVATHTTEAGRVSLHVARLTADRALTDFGRLDDPSFARASGPAVAAPSGMMLGVCVPDPDGTAVLQRHTLPTFAMSSRQPLGEFARCVAASGVGERTLLATGRSSPDGDRPFVMHFASAGAFTPRPALSDPAARGPIATAVFDEGFVWAGPTDGFGRIEVVFFPGVSPRPMMVAGFPRADGVPPVLARWPYASRAVAIVTSGGGLRLAVITEDGDELLRNDALAFQMFATPVPAMASIPAGLLLAQLDFGDADPFSGQISVHSIGRDGRADLVGPGPFGVSRRFESEGAEVDADGDADRVVVHYSWSSHSPGVVVETRTHALIFACQ